MKLTKLLLVPSFLVLCISKTAFAEDSANVDISCEPTCEVIDSYGYVSIGAGPLPLLLPNFNIGYRQQWHHHGFDIGANAATAGLVTQLKGYANWLYYNNPSLTSQAYFGLGASAGGWIIRQKHNAFIASPNILLGKYYTNRSGNRRFVQAEIMWPVFFSHRIETSNLRLGYGWYTDTKRENKIFWQFPLVTVSYGWAF